MANDFQFDDDEDDAPRPKRGKPRDDAPRSNRSRDEAPRSSKSRDENRPRKRRDEEEERPRSRRREEDEDDRPRKRRDEPDDDDDYTPPSRSKKKGARNEGMNPLRFVSPGTFIIAIVLFFLPWTDLSCSGPTGKMQLITQSGFESARGKFSEGSGIADMQKEQERMTGKKAEKKISFNEFAEKDGGKKDDDDGPQKAPVLWLYILLLIGGTIVPVLIAANRTRGMAVVGFAWFAVLLLIVQMLAGFPLSNEAAEMNDESKNGNNRMAGMGPVPPPPVGGPKAAGKNNNPGAAVADSVKVTSSFLASFYITIFVLVVTGGLGVVQYFMGAPPPKKKKASKKRSRRDDDEDDDDEDDDDR